MAFFHQFTGRTLYLHPRRHKMERSHISHFSEETATPTQTGPDPIRNLSRMRKLGHNATRFVRKMAFSVPSTPPGSPDPVTVNTTSTGEPDCGHLQSPLPPGFATPPGLPPGLPPPPGLPHPPGSRPPPGLAPLPPRRAVFGPKHSPPARRPGGTHLENCHSLSKTRVVSRHACVLVSTSICRPVIR